MLTDHEVERRLPVWLALAELFLDTELQPRWLDHIAETLNRSGFEKAELRRILEQEVAPAFKFNLLDIAGEWAGWPSDFVRARVLECMSPTPAWQTPAWGTCEALKMIGNDWLEVERRLTC